jgi:benzoate transport
MDLEIKDVINKRPMTSFQVAAVAICVLLNMLDGFDVLVVAFTASEISREWGLNATQMGALLSAGLVGMSAGSIVVAPLADVWGRRAVVLLSLSLVTLGMLLSALSRNMYDLATMRVVTGLGIGGMLASLTVISSEYASDQRRNLCVSLFSTGYPVGAVLGGSLSAFLIAQQGWRAVYACGGVVSLVMIPVVLARMPESLDFLLARRAPQDLSKVNTLLCALGHAELSELPAASRESAQPAGLRQLFKPPRAAQTLLIWTAFFVHMLCFYFVVSWTPKLLVAAGLSTTQGISGGVVLSLGGIAGGLFLGFASSRWPLASVTAGCMLLAGVAMGLFGLATGNLNAALPLAFGVGFLIYGGMIGIYTLTPQLYPALLRGTGMGFAIGMGRLGGILSPILAGVLLDAGLSPERAFFVFAAPLLLALSAVLALRRAHAAQVSQLANGALDARGSA